jgi:hypothetical protein
MAVVVMEDAIPEPAIATAKAKAIGGVEVHAHIMVCRVRVF